MESKETDINFTQERDINSANLQNNSAGYLQFNNRFFVSQIRYSFESSKLPGESMKNSIEQLNYTFQITQNNQNMLYSDYWQGSMMSGNLMGNTGNDTTVNYVYNFFQSPVVNDVSFYLGTGSTIIGLMDKFKFFGSIASFTRFSTIGSWLSFTYTGTTWGVNDFGLNEDFVNVAISALGLIPHPVTMGLSLYLTGVKMEYNFVVKPVINFANYVESHPFEAQNLMLDLFGGR